MRDHEKYMAAFVDVSPARRMAAASAVFGWDFRQHQWFVREYLIEHVIDPVVERYRHDARFLHEKTLHHIDNELADAIKAWVDSQDFYPSKRQTLIEDLTARVKFRDQSMVICLSPSYDKLLVGIHPLIFPPRVSTDQYIEKIKKWLAENPE